MLDAEDANKMLSEVLYFNSSDKCINYWTLTSSKRFLDPGISRNNLIKKNLETHCTQ